MFDRYNLFRNNLGHERGPRPGPRRRKRGPRIHLPSPVSLGLIALFVVLPLAWPESDELPSGPQEVASFHIDADITATVLSSDGVHLLAAARTRPVAHWRRAENAWSSVAPFAQTPAGTRSLALGPGERILAAGGTDGTVTVSDLHEGVGQVNASAGVDSILAVLVSPDAKVLAAASADSRIRLIESATGRVMAELQGHSGPVKSLAFFPDGRTLASGGDDGTIRFWDVANGCQVAKLEGSPGAVLSLAISAGGGLLASTACGEQCIRLWDTATRELSSYLRSDGANLTSLAFSAESGLLFSGDDLGTISLWDLATARPRKTFQAHKGWIHSLAVAQHGRILATGGNDGFVKVWDLSPGPRCL
ncbi:MAG: WD40 repeat domain-containing protein [Isosphaeraceae bacterium]